VESGGHGVPPPAYSGASARRSPVDLHIQAGSNLGGQTTARSPATALRAPDEIARDLSRRPQLREYPLNLHAIGTSDVHIHGSPSRRAADDGPSNLSRQVEA
jgi:hypothetical protein